MKNIYLVGVVTAGFLLTDDSHAVFSAIQRRINLGQSTTAAASAVLIEARSATPVTAVLATQPSVDRFSYVEEEEEEDCDDTVVSRGVPYDSPAPADDGEPGEEARVEDFDPTDDHRPSDSDEEEARAADTDLPDPADAAEGSPVLTTSGDVGDSGSAPSFTAVSIVGSVDGAADDASDGDIL